MNDHPNALRILQEERSKIASNLPAELVEDVYRIEFRVQFDDTRKDTLARLKEAVANVLNAEDLEGSSNADAI